MGEIQSIAKGLCPNCRSNEIFRSHRRGPLERYLLRAVGMRAYRCVACDARFYGFTSTYEQPAPQKHAA